MGRFAIHRLPRFWYVAARSHDLRRRPIARTILDQPIVLFRLPDGRARALLDRCAHRNAPLSRGRLVDGRLECPYHGWQYDGSGVCRLVPSLESPSEGRGRRVPAFGCVERQGYVWVTPSEEEPIGEPYLFPYLDDVRYTSGRYATTLRCTLHAAIENVLDVPHTAFLHRGLFRGGEARRITAIVRRGTDRVEAEYVGEPRPSGLAARLLAPHGGELAHWDRFLLPSITEVEYRLGDDAHIVTASAFTPVGAFETRMESVVSFRTRVPGALLRPFLAPLGRWIVSQDARMLEKQTETTRRFGGESFVSTEVDLLGAHVTYLLRRAERGDRTDEGPPIEKSITFLA